MAGGVTAAEAPDVHTNLLSASRARDAGTAGAARAPVFLTLPLAR